MAKKVQPRRGKGHFAPDADPIVHILQRAIEDSGLTAPQIAAAAMCTYQTVQRIVDGSVRLPRNTTRDRILEACGIEQKFYRAGMEWKP